MWEALLENIRVITPAEWITFISLTLYVILATKQNAWAWPVSMVGVSIYFYLAYKAQLYAELPLQIYYFLISIYGWYYWKFGNKKTASAPPPTTSSLKLLFILAIIGVIGTLGIGYLLDHLREVFDSLGMQAAAEGVIPTDVPYWDAFTTSFSLIATWMQARKKLENWLVWLVVDTCYVGIFIYKEYYLLVILNILYLFFATYGYFAWRNSMRVFSSNEISGK